ncbi:phosphatidate cytidylyltransferase [Streptomyces sp. NP-1717]|uniref:phosphatidate cytidylyltransferase n=1 Tax=Streptomyces sp. NP-1717 TaxID=2704470 RepID=UPI001F5DBD38|nr:phosphatidate cytidylyltransferase [Streptomyces sp. NP-1717]MCI3225324.1 phosphatidate cytidylyltransferase [Streptomyces sp. NP-1717]
MSAVMVAGEAVGRAVPLVAGALGASGIAVAALPSRVEVRAELRKRWRTWAIAAPVFLGTLFLGAGGAFALAAALGVTAVSEYARMTGLPRPEHAVLAVAAVVLPALAWLVPAAVDPRAVDLRVVALLLVAAVLPALLAGDHERGFTRSARTVFALLWIPLPLTGLVVLQETAVAVGLAVALGDIGAWCGGTALGRRGPLSRPLSPLSPSKTWAGVLGAAAATALALAAVGAFTPLLWAAVLAGCVLGDLLESMVKREAGVKDAGSWLPGFGGLLDRIDSLLLALLLAMVVTA